MRGKKIQCNFCSKVMRSDNLKRHTQSCMGDPDDVAEMDHQSWEWCCTKRRMSPNIPIFNGSNKSNEPPNNPKVEVLVDEIINDGSTEKLPLCGIPQKKVFQPLEEVLPNPSPDIVAAVFQEKEQPEDSIKAILLLNGFWSLKLSTGTFEDDLPNKTSLGHRYVKSCSDDLFTPIGRSFNKVLH